MPAIPTFDRTALRRPVPDAVRGAADSRRAWLLTLVYFCVIVFGAAHHEMWRDEWQAWMLARDSVSIADLLRNMEHEGHPPAWYLLLFALSRVSRNPVALQALNVLTATASVFVLARFSPLPWRYRVLIPFGYFFLFEYGVIARSYSLTVLALFGVCALFMAHRRHVIPLGVSLVVLATVSVYGLILAIALSFALLYERAGERRMLQRLRELHVNWKILFVIWLIVTAAAVVVMRPPQGFAGRDPPPARYTLWGVGESAGTLAWAYAPIPDPAERHVWNTHVVPARGRDWIAVRAGLAALFIAGGAFVFARHPAVLIMYAAGTGGLLLFQHMFFTGTLRHHGHYFILFVACLWLAHAQLRTWRLPGGVRQLVGVRTRGARAFILTLLVVQCVAGILLYAADVRSPFSAAPLAVRVLADNGLDELPIAVSPAPVGSSIAGQLDRPVHYIATQSESTFIPWGSYASVRDRLLDMSLLRRFIDAAPGSEVVIALDRPFEEWDADLRVREVGRLEAGLERTERYVLYHVTRTRIP